MLVGKEKDATPVLNETFSFSGQTVYMMCNKMLSQCHNVLFGHYCFQVVHIGEGNLQHILFSPISRVLPTKLLILQVPDQP